MAHARRSPQHRAPSSTISSPSIKRRNNLRRSASRGQSQADSSYISSPVAAPHRPVLVPLQPNLRRLPSRCHSQKDPSRLNELMRDSSHVMTGSKRKRVASTNENAHTNARPTRGVGRGKRLRTNSNSQNNYRRPPSSDSESELSEMEVDAASSVQEVDTDSDAAESQATDDDEGEIYDPSDDFLLHSAAPTTLHRQLKHRLVELYEICGLDGDPEALTKSEIVDAIVNNRDDVVSVPPSSPPGKSDYSSDDGHVAGGEETDAGAYHTSPTQNPLRRRVTMHDIGKSPLRPPKGRSFSMGNLLGHGEPPRAALLKRKVSIQMDKSSTEGVGTRRRVSTRSSPTSNGPTSGSISSPPTTRLRSRNVSTAVPHATAVNPTSSRSKGKGKTKQVEFSEALEVHLQSPSKRCSKGKDVERQLVGSESDLTELDDSDDEPLGEPSPRRLRSKDREQPKSKEKVDSEATPVASSKQPRKVSKASHAETTEAFEAANGRKLRVTPMRKAKKDIGSLKESEEEEELEHDELSESGKENEQSDEGEDAEEVDELVSGSSASLSPSPQPRVRQTPLKKRLRPRRPRKSTPTADEENEGDDEDEEGADDKLEDVDEDAEEGDEVEDETQEEEDDEVTIAVEPRKLRNGKIVGEGDEEMEVDGESVNDEEEVEEAGEGETDEADDDGETVDDAQSIDIDAEGDTDEDENMQEDVDLTVATAKTLIRLRRDDLVRLCETREIEPTGTKPQLAEALLQWRDRQGNEFSSPSSAGTIRPSSTRRKRKTKHHSSSTNTTVPVLLRSEHDHTDEPRTPVPGKEKEKENEDLELDLESLGLDDREIPPEKLTKLEKIGSGGFKDVFIGKFKNRKIAISEFRGQLSAMDIKELKLLGAFNHPNIVRFLGVSIPENTKETPVMIISELCSNGDLFDYIRNTNAPSLHKVLSMMLDIARGLEYLHTRKPSIIHRDCKSSNILITAKGTAKIADFGLAKVKQSTRSMVRSLVGTVNWQAPELWHAHPKYNHKVDVFSCAMVFWEMLQWHATTKKYPWEGMNEHAIYEIVGAKRQRPSIAGLKKQWCPELVELMETMWAHEHTDRPTMTQVVESLEDLLTKY
ncbi:hypothetical protein CPC08DRAFT_705375 [Agrocybe pediades]|nr:hypothetical protein CPC08DRAFT_705375 [Agrocybe pediades]